MSIISYDTAFEKDKIDQIYQNSFDILYRNKPCLIQSATDTKANEIIVQLKQELEAKKKELQDKSLEQGPDGKEQKRRPFVAIHAYAALRVAVLLMEGWPSREGRAYTIDEINKKYTELLAEDLELSAMIEKWKDPNDSTDEKFSYAMSRFLRLALTKERANLVKGSETISQVMESIEKERERKRR